MIDGERVFQLFYNFWNIFCQSNSKSWSYYSRQICDVLLLKSVRHNICLNNVADRSKCCWLVNDVNAHIFVQPFLTAPILFTKLSQSLPKNEKSLWKSPLTFDFLHVAWED